MTKETRVGRRGEGPGTKSQGTVVVIDSAKGTERVIGEVPGARGTWEKQVSSELQKKNASFLSKREIRFLLLQVMDQCRECNHPKEKKWLPVRHKLIENINMLKGCVNLEEGSAMKA